jgi:agmatine deiminase
LTFEFQPPTNNFRVPAEYERTQAVVLGWSGFTKLLTDITQAAISKGNVSVLAVQGPNSITGIDKTRYKPIDLPIDTVWVRDYGPFGIDLSSQSVGIVDSVYRHYRYRVNDDKLPSGLARVFGFNSFQAPIILDGGNFMVDSVGNLFMTKRTYNWNSDMSVDQVNSYLKQYFNAKTINAFDYSGYPGDPSDGTGHLDMFMKLLNDNTVLIATAEIEPFKSTAEKAIAWFQGKRAPNGQDYKILTVKGWLKGKTWYTYTNSLIVNNVVIVPSYANKINEEVAVKNAYQQGIPGIQVAFVSSDESITSGGSIHCVSQTIPAV